MAMAKHFLGEQEQSQEALVTADLGFSPEEVWAKDSDPVIKHALKGLSLKVEAHTWKGFTQ